MVFTNGKTVWNDKSRSEGFVPSDRAEIYFKIGGKIISRRQLFNQRFIVKMLPLVKRDMPDWCYD